MCIIRRPPPTHTQHRRFALCRGALGHPQQDCLTANPDCTDDSHRLSAHHLPGSRPGESCLGNLTYSRETPPNANMQVKFCSYKVHMITQHPDSNECLTGSFLAKGNWKSPQLRGEELCGLFHFTILSHHNVIEEKPQIRN